LHRGLRYSFLHQGTVSLNGYIILLGKVEDWRLPFVNIGMKKNLKGG
jgi:hypothetical protein